MPLSRRRLGAMASLAVPILAMVGLFAWAGTTSALSAQGANNPVGISEAFINDLNAGNCEAAIALIGSSPLHLQKPSCTGFSANSVDFANCSYKTGLLPSAYSHTVAGYENLQAVYASCTAKSSASGGLSLPVQLLVVTGGQSSTGALRIIDVQQQNG